MSSKAIGMIELSSQVELLRASTVCPGKYVVIVGGDTGDVKASMEAGLAQGGEFVVDSLRISNVHEQLIPALSGTVTVENPQAVGVVEFYSMASAILAADEAAKAANITLIEVRMGYAVGGKGFVTLTGDVGAVRAAVEAAKRDKELYVESTVIPRPAPQVFQSLL